MQYLPSSMICQPEVRGTQITFAADVSKNLFIGPPELVSMARSAQKGGWPINYKLLYGFWLKPITSTELSNNIWRYETYNEMLGFAAEC